jgi:hypothetical protein
MYTTSVEIFKAKKRALDKGEEVTSAQVGQGKNLSILSMCSGLESKNATTNLVRGLAARENMKATAEDKLSDIEVLGQVSCQKFIQRTGFIMVVPSHPYEDDVSLEPLPDRGGL